MTTQESSSVPSVECREAFEADFKKNALDFSKTRHEWTGCIQYIHPHVQSLFDGYQAAWNRRTEPSPAEVGSEGPSSLAIAGIGQRHFGNPIPKEWYAAAKDLVASCQALSQHSPATTPELIRYGKGHPASCICSLCKQSPARVEGELTDEEIAKLFEDTWPGIDLLRISGTQEVMYKDMHTRDMFIGFKSALNQRLAVKEGAPLTETYVQTVPDKCDRIVWRNSYYHLPLKDDQQAKDAARLDWLEQHDGRFYNIDRITAVVSVGLNGFKTIREAIDAALSATKQEEV